VLERSTALPDKVLVEVADRERIEHSILARIAARAELGETVTDSLLKRGNPVIQRTILENPNARVSENGFGPRDHGPRRRHKPRADGGGTPGSAA